VEQLLAAQPIVGRFCHGDLPGLADISLIPQVVNARNFECDLTPFSHRHAIFNAAMQLEAFERASPKYQPDADRGCPMSGIEIVTEFIQAWNDNDLDHAHEPDDRGRVLPQHTMQPIKGRESARAFADSFGVGKRMLAHWKS